MKRRLRRSTDVSTAASPPPPTRRPRSTRRGVAFESLYRAARDDVYAYVAGLLRDRSAAEEVTALAFERAWSRRRQIDPDRGSARAWLFGIARNAALDELRRRSRLAALPRRRPSSAQASRRDRERWRSGARPCAGRSTPLSGRERELVALKFFAGLSNSEIAEVIGTSESQRRHQAAPSHREAEEVLR